MQRSFEAKAARAMAIAVALLAAGAAGAQISSDSVRQRYQERTTGANIEDYVHKLESDDPLERLQGVRSLGESNQEKALEYLIQAVGDPDVRVKVKAIEMLGEMRATAATPVLVQHLFLRTTEAQMKQRILAALGKIGDGTAAKPIVEFLRRDLDPATRGTAIYALGDIGASEASEALEEIAKSDKNATLRRLAREALGKVQVHEETRLKEAKGPLETFLQPQVPED